MKRIDIIAPGKIRKTPYEDLFALYEGRLHWPLQVHEIEAKSISADEWEKIDAKIVPGAFVVALDERGKSMKSLEFSALFDRLQTEGRNHIQFLMGGADGLDDNLRRKADLVLSFGVQTWPHMLARIMLLEQIYRAQQILAGHPYHRE